MERVPEKVKDIVDVRAYKQIEDLRADLARTLGGYYFTDITADLMAKWIDDVAAVSTGNGTALALAGSGGVGKSHFLAAFTALLSRIDLRREVADPHVARATARLPQDSIGVVSVKRGSGSSLAEELKDAISSGLKIPLNGLPVGPGDLVLAAARHSDQTLVLLFDTFADRRSHVRRDDGPILSEIAEIAKQTGIFMCVALDDDISGADGRNSAISQSFRIDYLDQEHLYRVVESRVFIKKSQKLDVLRKIYQGYREGMPGFSWSEHRFSSLYPLHPAIIEVAPMVRKYLHDFTLLGFAADAGVKILGRPANSLIGLDEVFDSVESRLREAVELHDLFAVYDLLEARVVNASPVNLRLQSKLILKGLFLLSIDQRGAAAAAIASSMMVVDDRRSLGRNAMDVTAVLDSFAAFLPGNVVKTSSGGLTRYRMVDSASGSASDFEPGLLEGVSDDEIRKLLFARLAEHFSDVDWASALVEHSSLDVVWRGAVRRGSVEWTLQDHQSDHARDFTIRVVWEASGTLGPNTIAWRVAPLEKDEADAVRRLYVLQTDESVRDRFGPGLTSMIQAEMAVVDEIWRRIFFKDATLLDDQSEVTVSGTVIGSSVAMTLGPALAGIFENRFPGHPAFAEDLDFKRMFSLVSGFFGGSNPTDKEIQRLARLFALPLGLATEEGTILTPAVGQDLVSLVNVAESEVVPIEKAIEPLRSAPLGLTRESIRLILSGLVAEQHFDFVTASGNRISHRSLDLQLVWDDIEGLAEHLTHDFSDKELVEWTCRLTGSVELRSLRTSADKENAKRLLLEWLCGWETEGVIDQFDELDDERINVSTWKAAAVVRRTFGVAAGVVRELRDGSLNLHACQRAVAEAFGQSKKEFEAAESSLSEVRDHLSRVRLIGEIEPYIYGSDITDDPPVESARADVLRAISFAGSDVDLQRTWLVFRDEYAAAYLESHQAMVSSAIEASAACPPDLIKLLEREPNCPCGYTLETDSMTCAPISEGAGDRSSYEDLWGIEHLTAVRTIGD